MAIKIYKPTDSFQVYFDSVGGEVALHTATHLTMWPDDVAETFTIKDELNSAVVRDVPHADILVEAGTAAGADFAAVRLYLAKIIGG